MGHKPLQQLSLSLTHKSKRDLEHNLWRHLEKVKGHVHDEDEEEEEEEEEERRRRKRRRISVLSKLGILHLEQLPSHLPAGVPTR